MEIITLKEARDSGLYYGFIYKTTNLINMKIYVGQKKFSKRFAEDKCYLGSGKHFRNSVKFYGKENFIREILEYVTIEDIDDTETKWIAFYDATNPEIGYNIAKFGSQPMRGVKMTEENKKIRSEKTKGIKFTEEKKIKIRQLRKDNGTNKHSEESKKKMSNAQKGKIILDSSITKMIETKKKNGTLQHSEKTKDRMSKSHKGHSRNNEEVKNKISIANKKAYEIKRENGTNFLSEEHKKKIGEGLKDRYTDRINPHIGMKHSEETKEKMQNNMQNRPILICPYCNYESKNVGNMKKLHFDKCLDNPNLTIEQIEEIIQHRKLSPEAIEKRKKKIILKKLNNIFNSVILLKEKSLFL